MNFEINKLEVNNELTDTVDARVLHKELEIKTRFDMWISRRLEQIVLEENIDYIEMHRTEHGAEHGHNRVEYFLTIEAAKHIAMAERNDKGKEVRKYFINMETKAKKLEVEKVKALEDKIKGLESSDLKEVQKSVSKVIMLSRDNSPWFIKTFGINVTEGEVPMINHVSLAKVMDVVVPSVVACIKKHYQHIESNGVIKSSNFRIPGNKGPESKIYFLDRDAVTCVLSLSRNSNRVLELAREDMDARKEEAEGIIRSIYEIQKGLEEIKSESQDGYDELEYIESLNLLERAV